MTSTSTTSRSKAKKTSNMLVKGVEWTAPNFKLIPAIAESLDPSGAQSRIPSKAKARIELEIKLPKAITSTKRKVAKTEETEEESEEEAETTKKKGKVVITKPKPKTAMFTRRTRKGQKESEVVFRKPPPTFEEKLKQLDQGSSMSNFKALKYESRSDALGIKVDPSQHILLQLEEAVNRFNEDSSGEEKLIERTEKKFDNKVLEHIAQQIAIKQVELTTILAKLENSFNNVTSFFAKLCDVTEFTKGIRDQLKKIDDDLKASVQQLQLDPSSSSTHHSNIRFLLDKQSELLREDARIRLYRAFSKAHRLNSSNRAVRLSPSHQWLPSDTISTESPQLPSSKLHFGTSMDRASTLTESMTMPSTVVDAVYQKITEPA
ncbi:hypothetical protein SUGI_0514850 [Cryptomeria japonica]|nr:hypothetical protein SUGI_0514850 [Cryptomeria japonica]